MREIRRAQLLTDGNASYG